MKKICHLIAMTCLLMVAGDALAQKKPLDLKILNHLSAGVGVGTTGVSFELATPCTNFIAFRTGINFMPKFSYKTDLDYTAHPDDPVRESRENVDIKAKIQMLDWKLLADVYPIPFTGFHVTGGFYLGTDFPFRAHNTKELAGVEPGEGIEIGSVFVRPDENGIARMNVATKQVRPYVGLGFGRAVPNRRVSFVFDIGAQLWGEPCLKTYSYDEHKWVKVGKGDVDDDDLNDAIDVIKKIVVYPVLNLRINFRAI